MAAVKRSLNVGVVGVGRVGGLVLTNIAFKARNSMYLQVHSRSRKKANDVVEKIQRDGAQVALRMHDQYPTMTKWCDVIVACLKDGEAQRTVMLERPDALVRNAKRGQIIVDHTSGDVATARECYEIAQHRGAAYLDAPLSGTLAHARSGMLTAMIGGDRATHDRVLPLMRLYAENVHFMGPAGSGAAAKSISQALTAMHTVAAAEAVTMADAMGVQDLDKLLKVLDSTDGASMMLRRNASSMTRLVRNADEIPEESGSNVDGVLQSLSLVRASSAECPDSGLPLLTTSRRVFAQASQAGVGDRDISSVVHFLEGAAGAADPNFSEPADGEEPAVGEDAPTEFY